MLLLHRPPSCILRSDIVLHLDVEVHNLLPLGVLLHCALATEVLDTIYLPCTSPQVLARRHYTFLVDECHALYTKMLLSTMGGSKRASLKHDAQDQNYQALGNI